MYHYTGEPGFQGVVGNKTLRFTRSTQSNDGKDSVHVYDLIRDHKDEILSVFDENASMHLTHLLDNIQKQEVEWFNDEIETEKYAKAFVLCFTQQNDNRHLWAEYNGSKGYCLGFDSYDFDSILNSVNNLKQINKYAHAGLLMNVVYDKDKQINVIKSIIEDEYKKFTANKSEEVSEVVPTIIFEPQIKWIIDDNHTFNSEFQPVEMHVYKKTVDLYLNIASQIMKVSPFLKNSSWEDEGEERLCFYRELHNETFEPTSRDDKERDFSR